MGGILGSKPLWVDRLGCAVKFRAVCIWLLLAFSAEAADRLAVPSGQLVLPYEALWEDHVNEGEKGETWLVLRFLTPEIAKAKAKLEFADASPDIDFICENIGLPLVEMTGGGVDQIVVTMMDIPIPRGKRDPSVTQFMSAYRVNEGVCIWD